MRRRIPTMIDQYGRRTRIESTPTQLADARREDLFRVRTLLEQAGERGADTAAALAAVNIAIDDTASLSRNVDKAQVEVNKARSVLFFLKEKGLPVGAALSALADAR
jgi:hypothetical protein